MLWEKQGLIYSPPHDNSWRHQNANCPTPLQLDEKTLRIFCAMCTSENVGRIGYVDVDIHNPGRILSVSEKPVLDIGRPGSFDDNGLVPLSLLVHNGKVYLYYVGFQLGVKVPYYMFGGLAISEDGGKSFKKISESPVLDRTDSEIYARCGMCVIRHENKFKMWYIGSTHEGWTEHKGKKLPLYTMRYIESDDGINWAGSGVPCMEFASSDEHGFGRPFVWVEDGVYRQYYSIRTYSRGYYIGYAESLNGLTWERKDSLAGIGNSSSGWDSTAACYTSLFSHGKDTFMFYNGNGMGKTGFGYAKLYTDV